MNANHTLPVLAQGMLYKYRNDPESKLYRIVETGGGELWTHVSSVEDERWPESHLTEELSARFLPDFQGDDALEFVIEEDTRVSAQASDMAKTRLSWIAPLLKPDMSRAMFSPVDRGSIIKEHAVQIGKSVTTVKSVLKRFWARGMTAAALEGDRHKCGGKGKKRTYDYKPGAKRKHPEDGVGTAVTKDNISFLETAASYVLGAKVRRTLQAGLDFIREKFQEELPNSEPFTVRQLQWYINTKYPYTVKKRKQHGNRAYELAWRSFKGKADVYGPGAQFQIDATIADVYLVSHFNRLRIVGRPTIYIVSDTFSRLIVGVYISYSPPSREGAALALQSVATPKVALCHEYGIEISEADWPSHHLPRELLADRGSEFTSITAWEGVVGNLLINVANTAAFRPDWKSIVESRFNLIDAIWGPFVPGHIENDFRMRGGTDYRLDAVLTLREFTAVFLRSVIEYNNRPLRTKTQIPEMVAAGTKPTPVELWKFGIANRSGVLRTVPLDQVRACVYPRGRASVSHMGVLFATRFYESPRSIHEEWFDKARKGKWKVNVAYDPDKPERLFIIHEDRTIERATLRKTGPQYDDAVSLSEIHALVEDSSRNLNKSFREFEDVKAEHRGKSDEVVALAMKEKQAAMKSAGVKKLDPEGARDAKAEERELLERVRNGKLGDLDSSEGVTVPPDDEDEFWAGMDDMSMEALEDAERRARSGQSGAQR